MTIPARLVLFLIRSYKILISPVLTGACRFVPTCSEYMAEAVQEHGATRGVWLGLWRLGRCHPLGSAGDDPVPTSSDRSRAPGSGGNVRRTAWRTGVSASGPIPGSRGPTGH